MSPYLWSRGLKRLDVVALTHAHHDHLDGLHSVIANFRWAELWVGRDEETSAFLSLLAEARARGVRDRRGNAGPRIRLGRRERHVLVAGGCSAVTKASNDDSLVMRIQDGAQIFCCPGISRSTWRMNWWMRTRRWRRVF